MIGVLKGKRPQQDGIDGTENSGVGANAQSEGQDTDRGNWGIAQ